MADHRVAEIANKFVAVLREWFSQTEWATMCALNAAETKKGICHSHDFCDANMAMSEAFVAVTGHEVDGDNEADTTLWNAAWAAAMPELSGKAAACAT